MKALATLMLTSCWLLFACAPEPASPVLEDDVAIGVDEDMVCPDPDMYCWTTGSAMFLGKTAALDSCGTVNGAGNTSFACQSGYNGKRWVMTHPSSAPPSSTGCTLTTLSSTQTRIVIPSGKSKCIAWSYALFNNSQLDDHFVSSSSCPVGFVQCNVTYHSPQWDSPDCWVYGDCAIELCGAGYEYTEPECKYVPGASDSCRGWGRCSSPDGYGTAPSGCSCNPWCEGDCCSDMNYWCGAPGSWPFPWEGE